MKERVAGHDTFQRENSEAERIFRKSPVKTTPELRAMSIAELPCVNGGNQVKNQGGTVLFAPLNVPFRHIRGCIFTLLL